MSAALQTPAPGSVRWNLKKDSTDHDTANLAYALWQDRGAPFDASPEMDWIEAERRLLSEQPTFPVPLRQD